MTCGELQSALAIAMLEGSEDANLKKLNYEPMERILSLGISLVTIDPATDCVRFVHHTAHEYFTSTREEHWLDADAKMTKICLRRLLICTPLDADSYDKHF